MATATGSSEISFLSFSGDKYRGAVVELPPAFALDLNEKILKAIEFAYERDFSYIPVLAKDRKPIGYVDVGALKKKWEGAEAKPDDPILSHTTQFKRGKAQPYTVITPWTPLADLEAFLKDNDFAIGKFTPSLAFSDSYFHSGHCSYRLRTQVCPRCGDSR
ncbi:hypothetical protein FS837_009360 [Tulasnella sp. UAMH 9824]|nr:hypothetical protein FS837_009360 [Tulasnella sp. UAMH 9824]